MDIRTLVVMLAITLMGATVALAVTWLRYRKRQGTCGWAVGHGIMCVSMVFFILRGHMALPVSVLLGNGLYLMGAILVCLGTLRFMGWRSMVLWPIIAATCGVMALLAYFSIVHIDYSIRVIGFSMLIVWMNMLLFWVLMSSRRGESSWAVVLGMAFAAHAGFYLLRVALTVMEAYTPSLMSPSVVNQLTFVELILMVAFTSFGWVVLVRQHARQEQGAPV